VHKLFLKSQRVKKLPKAFSPAGKGQIVTDVSHAKLFHDSVWALYVEKCLIRQAHGNVHLHFRKSIAATKTWYRRYWNPHSAVTYCDYTGWDSGVDESFTLLYARLHRSMGVPASVVERFVHERHNARTYLGPFPAMQASGDRYTLTHNTVGDLALAGASFDVQPTTSTMVVGDDILFCGALTYQSLDVNRQFVPKVTVADTGEFAGLVAGEQNLYVDPATLLHRATIAVEDNRRDYDYWESISFQLRFADSGSFYDSEYYDACCTLIDAVYRDFNLPPSRFPVVFA
jgi:hypothetical protein